MVTNTVVLTLTPNKNDSTNEEATKACGDVAFLDYKQAWIISTFY